MNTIGIRREDKNQWERRVPLIPEDAKKILKKNDLEILVQPSDLRYFSDKEYLSAGAKIKEDLSSASLILAVKEVPIDLLLGNRTYVFFSHTIKGQDYNMPLLRKMMELKINLIDYERIIDEQDRRLIFFGKHAGLAGAIETLVTLADKLNKKGFRTDLNYIKQAYEYSSVEDAKQHFRKLKQYLKQNGFPEELGPLIVGFAGYGNVSKGAQEIFDELPFIQITPEELKSTYHKLSSTDGTLYKVVFEERHMVKSKTGTFDLQEYFRYPDRYTADFSQYHPYLTALINCIYWTDDYPRLVTKSDLSPENNSKIMVIGDISCDVEGSIEITQKVTYPDSATFTYFPGNNSYKDGTHREGITVMAIDNLPCEFSGESSQAFSSVLKTFIPEIAQADFQVPYDELSLPDPIKRALILHRGTLTRDYKYMKSFLNGLKV